MKKASLESGQALILIVFAIVGLVGLTGLAVDGGLTYSDRRRAQNAADNSALAAALAGFRDRDPVTVAKQSAANGGFNDNKSSNSVTVSIRDVPAGQCQGNSPGKDIT
ncbi:MAG: Tad domain-containing protein, partial [Anaerolineae bacterium]